MKLYDLLSTLVSLLSTHYFIRLNLKAWPVGIVATGLNGWLFWQKDIYADMFLQLFYCISFIYGWCQWSKMKVQNKNPIQVLSFQKTIYLILAVAGLYLVILWVLKSYSSSSVAKLDALTTALSLIAQCLMCYKIMTTWILWLLADLLYAGLYFSKNLPFHTLLAFFYGCLAIHGYIRWGQEYTHALPNQSLGASIQTPGVSTA